MPHDLPSRRDALAVFAVAALAASGAAAQTGETPMTDAELARHARDWQWLAGRWNVRHRRLNGRLVGSTDWQEFNGASECWLTMGGFGTCDDNVIELPAGTYRAMGVRGFNRETRQWSIWWLDERYPTTLGEPVRGGFRDGVGIFTGDDTLDGRPIKVRFNARRSAGERDERMAALKGGPAPSADAPTPKLSTRIC
jgi:hypothetical protein